MFNIIANPNETTEYTEKKDAAKATLIEALKKAGAAFWAYTEETGETDTSSFKGIL